MSDEEIPGTVRMLYGQSITKIEYDHKEMYYEAMIAIAEFLANGDRKIIEEQLALHRVRSKMMFVVTNTDPAVA